MNLDIDPRLFNPLYWHILDAMSDEDIRMILLMGGSSSGKSYSYSQAVNIDTLQNPSNTMMMRKYNVDINDSIYADVKGFGSKLNKYTNNYEFIRGLARIGSSQVKFRGLDDSERIKGLASYKRVILDELNQFAKADLDQIKKRLRGMPGQQILASWNPISTEHWVKNDLVDLEYWEDLPTELEGNKLSALYTGQERKDIPEEYQELFDGKPKTHSYKKINKKGNILLIKSTFRDNFWVCGHPSGKEYGYFDNHVLDNFLHDKIHNPVDYDIYANGEWGVITDKLIFPKLNYCEKVPENAKRIPTGLDFGYNPDPTAAVDLWIRGNEVYIKERLYKTNLNYRKSDVDDSIQEELEKSKFDKSQLIICESAEPRGKRELMEAGFNIWATSKKSGYKIEMIKIMRSYSIFIVGDSPNVKKEWSTYERAEDKQGTILPQPKDGNDHTIDATFYVFLMRNKLW